MTFIGDRTVIDIHLLEASPELHPAEWHESLLSVLFFKQLQPKHKFALPFTYFLVLNWPIYRSIYFQNYFSELINLKIIFNSLLRVYDLIVIDSSMNIFILKPIHGHSYFLTYFNGLIYFKILFNCLNLTSLWYIGLLQMSIYYKNY